jgi:hypothetical protein
MSFIPRRFYIAFVVATLGAVAGDGLAQGYGGIYGRDSGAPSGYGGPSPYGESPYGQPVYGAPPQQNPAYPPINPRCRDLEYQLTNGGAGSGQDQLPRIENDMRQADAQFQRAQIDADRANCYEDMFLFGRTLRRTPRCIDLDRQVQAAKATLEQLRAQRESIIRGNSYRARRDDIIAELARNRCGDQYTREYEAQRGRNSSIFSFFSNEDSDDTSSRYSPFGGGPGGGSTYRTLCVRECDGFYFPISNETTDSHFQEDEAKCHAQCAAPAQLFYHRSDQDVEEMVALSGQPYAQMPYAFRNRKVYIRGCSCNQNEYSLDEIAKSEEALKRGGTSKRADASSTKTSDSAFARRISQAVQNAPSSQPGPSQNVGANATAAADPAKGGSGAATPKNDQ